MKISVRKGDVQTESCDVLILTMTAWEKTLPASVHLVDQQVNGLLSQVIKEEGFKAQAGQTLLVRTEGLLPAKRVLLIGLGKMETVNLESVREASAVCFHLLRGMALKKLVCLIPVFEASLLQPKEVTQSMTEGFRLAAYVFNRYKKQKKNGIGAIELLTADGRAIAQARKGLELGELFAQGTEYARDLVNTPAMHLTPVDLVNAAKEIAKKNPQISVKVFDQAKLEKMGAGGILGVAQGSEHPPFLVHMIYKPKGRAKKTVALVGKAVTFDSGGLSLKPAEHMMSMKVDMAGSASVLGAFSVLNTVAPKVEVHGIFAAVENMPAGNAIRPGDIVEALNKKTVEVLNTDAEGRLTLMDALVYAAKQKPNLMIDLATLTGACMVALGEEITGVMSNNKELTQTILTASEMAGERMWELPLEKAYQKLLKSPVADLQNIGGRYGGALTAGLFLQEFVDPKMPWAHLDIAGPAFAERDINPYTRKGATGHGVRTLLQFLLNI